MARMCEFGYVYVMYQGLTVLGVYTTIAAADRNAPTSGDVMVLKHRLDDNIYGTYERILLPSQHKGPVEPMSTAGKNENCTYGEDD